MLARRILSYYKFQYTSLQLLDESSVLVGLPRSLKLQMDIVVHQARRRAPSPRSRRGVLLAPEPPDAPGRFMVDTARL